MRPIPAEPPPFFRRGPSALARVTFFGLASIVLLFVDARFRYLEDVRQVAGAILFPLQRLVRVPGEALRQRRRLLRVEARPRARKRAPQVAS